MSSSVFIFGYHGKGNYGDDIFLAWTLSNLKLIGVSRVFVSAPKGRLRHKMSGLKVEAVDKHRYRITRFRWFRLLPFMIRSRSVVWSSGSLFRIQPFLILYISLCIHKVLSFGNARLFAISISVGPFKHQLDRLLCSQCLKRFDSVTFRDDSWHRLTVNGELKTRNRFIQTGDLALAWLRSFEAGNPKEKKESTTHALGVSVNRDVLSWANSLDIGLDSFSRMIGLVLRRENLDCVKILVACVDERDGDQEVSLALEKRLVQQGFRVDIVYNEPNDPLRITKEIVGLKKLLSSRMHPGIVGMYFGVPTLHLGYAEKIEKFHSAHRINDLRAYVGKKQLVFDGLFSIQSLVFPSEKCAKEIAKILKKVAERIEHEAFSQIKQMVSVDASPFN